MSEDRAWKKGDIVQALWEDDYWYTAELLEDETKGKKNSVRFIVDDIVADCHIRSNVVVPPPHPNEEAAPEQPDTRFYYWLQLHSTSDNRITHMYNDTISLFRDGVVDHLSFDSDTKLRNKLRKYAEKNNRTIEESFKRDEVVAPLNDELKAPEDKKDTPSCITTVHKIEAIGKYALFLGKYNYTLTDELIKKLSNLAKFEQQSSVSTRIQDPGYALTTLTDILTQLKKRQVIINTRITRWLQFGNLVENQISLAHFGLLELRPFIEMCFRFTYLPMSIKRVRTLRIARFGTELPTDMEYLFGEEALLKTRVQYTTGGDDTISTSVNDILYLHGDHFVHVYMVSPAGGNQNQCKPVVHHLPRSLSIYMFFYHHYCKRDTYSSMYTSKWDNTNGTALFYTGEKGGFWDDRFILHIGTYCEHINIPPGTIQFKNDLYKHHSRTLWLAARSYLTNMNPVDISIDATVTDSGFAQENKYYKGMEGLRATKKAQTLLTGKSPPEPPKTEGRLTLRDTPREMDSLFQEMRLLSGQDPNSIVYRDITGTKRVFSGTSDTVVEQDTYRKLFSPEYLAHSGKNQPIETFVSVTKRLNKQRTKRHTQPLRVVPGRKVNVNNPSIIDTD
jgi:hypothetical protein